MKHIITFFATLSIIMLSVACNEIESVGIDTDSVLNKQMTSNNHDVKVTLYEAIGIADMFICSNAGINNRLAKSADANTKKISSTETIREEGQNLMYVVNYEDGGFVIIGSTRDYYPILAYSDKGSFELSDDMGAVDVWLDETKVSIKNSSTMSNEIKAQMRNLWARYDETYTEPSPINYASGRPQTRSTGEDACWERIETLQSLYGSLGWTFLPLSQVEDYFTDLGYEDEYDEMCYSASQNHSALSETVIGYKNGSMSTTQVGPLLQTKWNQSSPYNTFCPGPYAGCAAVAVAQVMRYHQHPQSLTWDGVNFTWNDVINSSDSTLFIARLIRRAGSEVTMHYWSDYSWAIPSDVYYGLINLGYSTTKTTHSILPVRNNLYLYNRPVIMLGSTVDSSLPEPLNYANDSHYWVCDGAREVTDPGVLFYTENQPYGAGTFYQGMYSYSSPGTVGGVVYLYFHMNWGWGGSHDGWFASNNVNSGNGNFQYSRQNYYVSPM